MFEPWINFEADALCKGSSKSNISPIMINISKLKPPLSYFQATRLNEDDLLRLFRDINRSLGKNNI